MKALSKTPCQTTPQISRLNLWFENPSLVDAMATLANIWKDAGVPTDVVDYLDMMNIKEKHTMFFTG